MKKIILVLGTMLIVLLSINKLAAQDSNILIGLDGPSYGVKIKTNFPGRTSTWARGFILSNEDNTEDFTCFGSFGSVLDGKSSLGYSFIGKAYNKTYIAFRPDGNVGIGTTNPNHKLSIVGNSSDKIGLSINNTIYGNSQGNFFFIKTGSSYVVTDQRNAGLIESYNDLVLSAASGSNYATPSIKFQTGRTSTTGKTRMVIDHNGNVGIGTTNPKYLLSVKGKIGAGEIVVENVTTWSDFVFNNDYKLMPLAEVENFIQENNHLPDVPSETEVKEKGINVAEMNAKLLQKIEELTLYMIEMKKENDEMRKRLEIVERK